MSDENHLKIINPLEYPEWDRLVLSTQGYSFFHSSAWARVLNESYGYMPLYFALIDNGRLLASIPCMEIKSIITGKRAVCLPFTDYCEPLFSPAIEKEGEGLEGPLSMILNALISYGKKATWKTIEFRFGVTPLQKIMPSYTYYGHTLDISGKEDEIYSSFRSSTKRNINKAIKEGVKIRIVNSLDSISEFYRLNCITRKGHGLPPQPFVFFEKIYEHVLSTNNGFVVLASYDNTCIAGAVYFHFGEKATYKYGASDRNYQQLRPNNLVMWEAIKWCSQNGLKSICFGRTEPDNKGLLQFKRGWGSDERILNYYKYDIKSETFVSDTSHLSGVHNKFFHNMPIPLLKITGAVLYKHIG